MINFFFEVHRSECIITCSCSCWLQIWRLFLKKWIFASKTEFKLFKNRILNFLTKTFFWKNAEWHTIRCRIQFSTKWSIYFWLSALRTICTYKPASWCSDLIFAWNDYTYRKDQYFWKCYRSQNQSILPRKSPLVAPQNWL